MEYLMTYGWAILVIAVILALLFALGLMNGSDIGSTSSCIAASGFSCTNPSYSSNSVSFTLGQDTNRYYYGDWVFVASSSEPLNASGIPVNFSTSNSVQIGGGMMVPGQSVNVNFTKLPSGDIRSGAPVGYPFSGYIWLGYCTDTCTAPTGFVQVATINAKNSGHTAFVLPSSTSTTSTSTSSSTISTTTSSSSTSSTTLATPSSTTTSTSTSITTVSIGGGCGSSCYATFYPQGGPSSGTWSVTYDGQTESDSINGNGCCGITFTVTGPASYGYNVQSISVTSNGCTTTYSPSPSSGSASATGGGTSTYISFSEAPTTCETVFGLGSPSSLLSSPFTVTYDGIKETTSLSGGCGQCAFFNTPPGSYSFSIGSGPSPGSGCSAYAPSPQSGSATAGSTTFIDFSSTCTTSLALDDIPNNGAGYTFTLSYGGSTQSFAGGGFIGDSWQTSPGNYIMSASVPSAGGDSTNGCYPSFSSSVEAGSSISYTGPYTCIVLFTQYGLPSGHTWTVTWDGSSSGPLSSSTTSYEFGTYLLGSYSWSLSTSGNCHDSGTQYAGVNMGFGLSTC